MWQRIKNYVTNVYYLMRKPEMLTLPSSLAFYFVLSIVPVISIFLLIATNLNISTSYITNFFEKYFSSDIVNLITPTVSQNTLNIAFIIHLVVAFFIVSNGANAIIVASNMVFDKKNGSFIKRRTKSIFLTLILIMVISFMLVVPVFGRQLMSLLGTFGIKGELMDYLKFIYPIVRLPLTAVVIYIGVKIIYVLAPDSKIKSNYVIKGSLFTTVGWLFATYVYSYYTRNIASYNLYYAGLSTIVVLMIWFYFLAFIFVLGLSMNYQKAEEVIERTNAIKLKEIEEKVKMSKMSK